MGAAGKKRPKKWLPRANSGQNKMIHNNTDTINFIPPLLYHNPPPSDLLLPPPTATICRRSLLIPTSATIRHSPLPSAAVFGRPPPSATICRQHQIIVNPVESQETETCLCFLYSRVCLWSIVVNSAKKLSRQNKASTTARGGQSGQICPRAK